MISPCTRRHTRGQRRALTVGLSTLAMGATVVGGSSALAAEPAPIPHPPQSLTNRVLDVQSTSDDSHASRTTQLEYVNPHTGVTYLTMDQYAGAKRNYLSWEKDTPAAGGKRHVDQVDVDPATKSWSEQSATVRDLPAPSLGIQSSAGAVRQAIEQGRAIRQGQLKVARGPALLLSVRSASKPVVSEQLYVNPQHRSADHGARADVGRSSHLDGDVLLAHRCGATRVEDRVQAGDSIRLQADGRLSANARRPVARASSA